MCAHNVIFENVYSFGSFMNGISNKLLKRYWPYFRIGIHKYALRCFETGRLTDVFRGATVKLIPRKGDLSQLKKLETNQSLVKCI